MTRREVDLLNDIIGASLAIEGHLERGGLDDPLVLDAVKMQLIVIGEAVKGLPEDLTSREPGIAWRDAAGMKDWLTHHYFDVDTETLQSTVENELPEIVTAVSRLRDHVVSSDGPKK